MNELELLFLAASIFDADKEQRKFLNMIPTCRNCIHRQRFEPNDHSSKVIQCCVMQPSKRSNSGYKTIKVTDKACNMYQELTNN